MGKGRARRRARAARRGAGVDEHLGRRLACPAKRAADRGATPAGRRPERPRISRGAEHDRPMTTPAIIASGNGAKALPEGVRILKRGGSALDAVEACARVVETDVTDTSVGRGGLPRILAGGEADASL